MNRRILAALLLCLAVASPAFAVDSGDQPTPWWFRGLTFHAPFDDPAAPLKTIRGSGSLTFTRAHDATHTATYVHPGTGLVTVANNNQLRIEAAGALLEAEQTQLMQNTENFSGWTSTGTSITVDNAVAPDGTQTADLLLETDATQAFDINYYHAKPASSQTITYSIHIKPHGRTKWRLMIFNQAYSMYAVAHYDLTAGTTSALDNAGFTVPIVGVDAAPNGYSRIRLTTTTDADDYNVVLIYPLGDDGSYSHAGDPAKGGYLWGMEAKIGAATSSHVPMALAAITRNADVLTLPTSGNLDNTAGTIALTWTPGFASTAAVGTAVLFDAGGIKATYTSADRKINLTDGTNTVSSAALTFAKGAAAKLAFRYGTSGLLVYKDGAQAATGATYTAAAMNANLYIGSDISSANQAFSSFKIPRAWNREFTAAEMQSITR